MLSLMIGLGLCVGLAAAAAGRGSGDPVSWLKDQSDRLLALLLRGTSRFGRELTGEGLEEQAGWRHRRLRDMRPDGAPALAGGRKRIVVLGGGSGGLATATYLGRRLGHRHEVLLVDRRPDHVFMPAFLFLMVGQREPEDISRKLKRVEKNGVRVVQSEVVGIDPSRQQIHLESGPLPYDYLVISLGMRTAPELMPGFAEAAEHCWELESALRLRQRLHSFQEGKILVGVPAGPYRCPPAPFEAHWMLDSYFQERGIRHRVEIEHFTPGEEPAGEMRTPAVWMDAQSRSRKVRQHYSFVPQSIDPDRRVVRGLYGPSLSYDLLFMIPPHEPSRVLVDSGLVESRNGMRVDYDTLATRWGNVFAIGDCADMPVSKSGGVAHQQAEVVANNLAVELTGEGERSTLRLHTL